MSEQTPHLPVLVAMVGLLIMLAVIVRALLERCGLPALIGFLALGLAVRFLQERTGWLGESGRRILELLGSLGVISLLFRVGLEGDLRGLLKQLRGASLIRGVNIIICAALGYLVGYYLLDLGNIPSLVVGIAMTATSVGIPSGVWRRLDRLNTPEGERFLDVAELDDISGVMLMAIFLVIMIGFQLEPSSLVSGAIMGSALLLAAVAGKIIGTTGPALMMTGGLAALTLGVSMIPRAEISMLIMEKGRQLGDDVVPPAVYAGMIFTAAATSILGPLALHPLLRRLPKKEGDAQ